MSEGCFFNRFGRYIHLKVPSIQLHNRQTSTAYGDTVSDLCSVQGKIARYAQTTSPADGLYPGNDAQTFYDACKHNRSGEGSI
jgi:hypothetical protein